MRCNVEKFEGLESWLLTWRVIGFWSVSSTCRWLVSSISHVQKTVFISREIDVKLNEAFVLCDIQSPPQKCRRKETGKDRWFEQGWEVWKNTHTHEWYRSVNISDSMEGCGLLHSSLWHPDIFALVASFLVVSACTIFLFHFHSRSTCETARTSPQLVKNIPQTNLPSSSLLEIY